jgi:outer membrane PBP1 activator LpoA protein
MNTTIFRLLPILLAAVMVGGCASTHPDPETAKRCEDGIAQADAEFNGAQAEGLGAAVEMIKASALINAARVQRELGKFPNCVDKVGRARAYIADARKR